MICCASLWAVARLYGSRQVLMEECYVTSISDKVIFEGRDELRECRSVNVPLVHPGKSDDLRFCNAARHSPDRRQHLARDHFAEVSFDAFEYTNEELVQVMTCEQCAELMQKLFVTIE